MASFGIVNSRKDILKNKLVKFAVKIILLMLLIGLAYIVLYPFIFKILSSFMTDDDLYDDMVDLIPKHWTLERYWNILKNNEFLKGLGNTFLYSFGVAAFSAFSSSFVGYGLARFKFRGNKTVFLLVVLTMFIPLQTIYLPLYTQFRFFDVFGIISLINGNGISLINTPLPMFILAATCLGFRAGIFVILMRQYYLGIPKELIEAAYVDGSTTMNTFFKVILPMAKSMLIVVFSLSFAWQWTDTFYCNILNSRTTLLPSVVISMNNVAEFVSTRYVIFVNANTAAILAILPLIILYCILQKQIIQGIESSGIVG